MNKQGNQKEEIQQGMQLTAIHPDIMPGQADGQIRSIYEDIQRTLRVPIVNLIFRTLANYPDYLEHMWKELSLIFRTNSFENEADALRKMALLEHVPDSSEVEWESLEEIEQLRAFNDTIFYVLPKLLLVTTTFYQASFGNLSGKDLKHAKGHDLSALPLGAAEGTKKVQMVDPEKASERVTELFNSIKEKHGHPLVSSYYRGLANWPDFLEEAWSRIEPLVGSSAYEERKQELIKKAIAGVQNLPVSKIEKPEISGEQSQEIRKKLIAFQQKFIPEMLLDTALIKAMLDGKKSASYSRFSVGQ